MVCPVQPDPEYSCNEQPAGASPLMTGVGLSEGEAGSATRFKGAEMATMDEPDLDPTGVESTGMSPGPKHPLKATEANASTRVRIRVVFFVFFFITSNLSRRFSFFLYSG